MDVLTVINHVDGLYIVFILFLYSSEYSWCICLCTYVNMTIGYNLDSLLLGETMCAFKFLMDSHEIALCTRLYHILVCGYHVLRVDQAAFLAV